VIEDYFSSQGQLAKNIKGFKHRPQQVAMANAVDDAINQSSTLVVEAGTGVGKTFAYLIPAMLSGKKVVVSTGTRHLQDQLFYTDLPLLQQASSLSMRASILKGRSNYLCKYRFQRFEHELRDYRKLKQAYYEIKDWSSVTKTGDIAEVNQLSEQSEIWSHVTSTRDNCLGGECPEYSKCYVLKARKQAQESDLVVINHHLLCADLVLKGEGFGELLPMADVFVLDEAHQLTEVLPNFFGSHLSSRQLQELVADVSKECTLIRKDVTLISKNYYAVLDGIEKLYSSLAKQLKKSRELWRDVISNNAVTEALENLIQDLLELENNLINIANESPGIAQAYKRIGEINGLLDDFKSVDHNAIQWIELGRRRFVLGSVPLNVSGPYQRAIQEYQCAWIYTSATLTAKQSFNHFTAQLGLEYAECVMCDSPYDYPGQSRLYLPSLMHQPNEEGYTEEVIETAIPLLEASRGNAFVLFTSHKALNLAANLMENKQFNVLVQGSAAKRELLVNFQKTDNCVLLGTQSFWEGVDVKGQNLRLVIIDKLPFVSPADPLVRARSKALEEAGENPFVYYQIPQAILNLKQGVGRLIRGEQDCGVVVLMDPRIKTKNYGKSFLKSLPPMTISEDIDHIKQFLEVIHNSETT